MISEQDIEKARYSDIASIVSARVQIKKSGKNWSGCCPFHKEKSPSFTVSEQKGMYYCFGCGAGGGPIDFIMEYEGVSFPVAVEIILGGQLSADTGNSPRKPIIRATRCELPGHAEDREKSSTILSICQPTEQHKYLMQNNTAPHDACLINGKGILIVPLINNIGETVNVAAITTKGITYAAGNPSFGSTAILEPADASNHDGKTIICIDYAHAWRIWWSQSGRSKVLCTMEYDNFNWMLANCKDRFTHIGCDPSEADHHVEEGRAIIALPLDPYAKVDKRQCCA